MKISYPDFVAINKIVVYEDLDYRYYLAIPFCTVCNPDTLVVIMKNPSDADAKIADPTARRVCDFAYSNKFGRVVIVNLFAYRTKDKNILKAMYDKHDFDYIVGVENDNYIINAIKEASKIIVAWGKPPEKFSEVYDTRINQLHKMADGIELYYVETLWENKYPLHGLRWSTKKSIKNYSNDYQGGKAAQL